MSAQLNTVSGTIYEDFVVKMMNIKVSELTASIIMKCTVVVVGFTCVCLVTVVEKLGGILQARATLRVFANFARLRDSFCVSDGRQFGWRDTGRHVDRVHVGRMFSTGQHQGESSGVNGHFS